MKLGDSRHRGEPEAPSDESAVSHVREEAPEVKVQFRTSREMRREVRVRIGVRGDGVTRALYHGVEAFVRSVRKCHDVTLDRIDTAPAHVDGAVGPSG